MSLFSAELQRLVLRRITRFLPLGVVGLMLGGMTIAFFVTNNGDFTDAGTPWEAVEALTDDDESPESAGGILSAIGGFLGLITFVIGASYVGADAKVGMIEQILTWESRRGRLVAARIVASLLVCFALIVLLLLAFSLLFTGLILLRGGDVGSIDGDFLSAWFSVVGRAALAGALISVLGVTIAFLTNSSVGAIVGWFIYAFIIESLISAFWTTGALYTPLTNAGGFINGVGVYGAGEEIFSFGEIHHGPTAALLILIGYVVAASVISLVVFQRRDIS